MIYIFFYHLPSTYLIDIRLRDKCDEFFVWTRLFCLFKKSLKISYVDSLQRFMVLFGISKWCLEYIVSNALIRVCFKQMLSLESVVLKIRVLKIDVNQ